MKEFYKVVLLYVGASKLQSPSQQMTITKRITITESAKLQSPLSGGSQQITITFAQARI